MNKTNCLILMFISTVVGSTVLAFTYVRKEDSKAPNATNAVSVDVIPQYDEGRFDNELVQLAALTSDLRPLAMNLGDRLHKPGKERVTYAGTMQREGDNRATPFTLIWEMPGRIRLIDYGRQQVSVFDGETVSRSADASDDTLLETLLCDSADHLLISQMRGGAMRSLGSRFRMSEDSTREYAGPFYDVFELTETIPWDNNNERTRQYWFNSDTQLLELVKYRVSSNGAERMVEVRLTNWSEVNGQRFPSGIIRLENDIPIISLDFNLASTAVRARVEDGMFSYAPNNQ